MNKEAGNVFSPVPDMEPLTSGETIILWAIMALATLLAGGLMATGAWWWLMQILGAL